MIMEKNQIQSSAKNVARILVALCCIGAFGTHDWTQGWIEWSGDRCHYDLKKTNDDMMLQNNTG